MCMCVLVLIEMASARAGSGWRVWRVLKNGGYSHPTKVLFAAALSRLAAHACHLARIEDLDDVTSSGRVTLRPRLSPPCLVHSSPAAPRRTCLRTALDRAHDLGGGQDHSRGNRAASLASRAQLPSGGRSPAGSSPHRSKRSRSGGRASAAGAQAKTAAASVAARSDRESVPCSASS